MSCEGDVEIFLKKGKSSEKHTEVKKKINLGVKRLKKRLRG